MLYPDGHMISAAFKMRELVHKVGQNVILLETDRVFIKSMTVKTIFNKFVNM